MKRKELNNPLKKVLFTSFILLLLDQITKILVITYPPPILGFEVFGFYWFKIRYVLNEGMAFGWVIPGDYGKLILTLFRIIVVVWGLFYVNKLIKQNSFSSGLLICFGLIIGGALGNIIDSIFYGVIFNDSYNSVASLFPESGGYAPLLHGKVVDMFYFPLINSHFPNWMPFIGGDHFIFFRPVFNIADTGISVGIFIILIFYRKLFN